MLPCSTSNQFRHFSSLPRESPSQKTYVAGNGFSSVESLLLPGYNLDNGDYLPSAGLCKGGNLALFKNICLGANLKGRVRFLSVALMRGSSSNRRAFPPIWEQNSSAFSRKPCREAIMPTPSSHASGYVGTHSVSGGGRPSPPCLPAGAGHRCRASGASLWACHFLLPGEGGGDRPAVCF